MVAGGARELGDHNLRDHAGPLVAAGWERAVAPVLLEWLQEDDTPRLELWGLEANGAFATAMMEAAAYWGWVATTAAEAVCPAAQLPSSYEAYVASLPKHDRHELRRKARKLAEGRTVRFTMTGVPAEVTAGIPRLLAQMRASRPDKDAFLTDEMAAFFADMAAVFAELGLARFGSLWVDDVETATLLCFETRSTLALYNSGFLPEWQPLSVGLLSKARALEWAIEAGKSTFDFLRGEEEYKRHLGGVARELVGVCVSSGGAGD